MLILSRKKGERIVIVLGQQTVEVTVCDIRSDKVRLGFTAPLEVAIHRREIYDAIQRGEPPRAA